MPSRDGDRLKASQEQCKSFFDAGLSKAEIFERLASQSIEAKEASCANRCKQCWHDKEQRCICAHIPDHSLTLMLNVKVLVLMHHKEYLCAGDDAKLLLAALPSDRSELFIFGKSGDWQRLAAELAVDPTHTLLLWPGDGAATVDEFVASLPASSPWRGSSARRSSPPKDTPPTNAARAASGGLNVERPLLRVIVLDGVYAHARSMFRHIRKELPAEHVPRHVALHPNTLSVYHRAQQSYARDSAATVVKSDDPAALRICTVEAFALLLEELGEDQSTTKTLVRAVVVNNEALNGADSVRPDIERKRSTTSGRARRRQWKEQQRTKVQPPSTSRWLDLDDPFELLASAIAPPWAGTLVSKGTTSPADGWEELPLQSECDEWSHSALWVPRPSGGTDAGGRVCVHRFRPRRSADARRRCEQVAALVDDEMKQSSQEGDGSASNVNGAYHSARDLWSRPAFAATGLPEALRAAADRANSFEAQAIGRDPLPLAQTPEAWFNALPQGSTGSEAGQSPGGWNTLHTHPGCSFACAYFVASSVSGSSPEVSGGGEGQPADSSSSSRFDNLASFALDGRLVLLPAAPKDLSEHHRAHVRGGERTDATSGQCVTSQEPTEADPAAEALRYLLIDPIPGELLIWPSFVPHFVAPSPCASLAAEQSGHVDLTDEPRAGRVRPTDSDADLRISIACNF